MIAMEAGVDVDASTAEVWAVLADYARDVEWRRGVRSMVATPSGPVRTGTTTVEWLRSAGRTMRNDGEVTAVDDGRRFAWRTTAGVEADGSREVVATEDGCRVRLETRVRIPGLLRWVPGLRGALRRGLQADADRLRTLVERSRDAPGPHMSRKKNSSALPSGSLKDSPRP